VPTRPLMRTASTTLEGVGGEDVDADGQVVDDWPVGSPGGRQVNLGGEYRPRTSRFSRFTANAAFWA
jgi:hypothetical protein